MLSLFRFDFLQVEAPSNSPIHGSKALYATKNKLQCFLLLEGIQYEREIRAYRTKEANSVYLINSYLSDKLQNKKSGII